MTDQNPWETVREDEDPEPQFVQKNTDYYREWFVTIGADDAITIHADCKSITLSAKGWIDIAQGGYPESDHIKAFMIAIQYYFPPGDALKIQKKYLELINSPLKPVETE